jgi:hypothetical protein
MKVNEVLPVFGLGVVLGIVITNYAKSSGEQSEEQAATDDVIASVKKNDEESILQQEKVLFYEESFLTLKAQLDSIQGGIAVQVDDLTEVVNSDFDNLPDSTKLAYRKKVLERLRNQ